MLNEPKLAYWMDGPMKPVDRVTQQDLETYGFDIMYVEHIEAASHEHAQEQLEALRQLLED